MCGRLCCALSPEQVRQAAHVSKEAAWDGEERFRGQYNVSPGGAVPCLRTKDDGSRSLCTVSFGMPFEDGRMRINARVEGLQRIAQWRKWLQSGRGVVFCRGFFEWEEGKDGQKRPYYVHAAEGDVMAIAALCDDEGHAVLITSDACESLRWLHDRMPCLLPFESYLQEWLDGRSGASSPRRGDGLAWHAVTRRMGHVSTQGPECIAKLEDEQLHQESLEVAAKKGWRERAAADPHQKRIHQFFTVSPSKRPKTETP